MLVRQIVVAVISIVHPRWELFKVKILEVKETALVLHKTDVLKLLCINAHFSRKDERNSITIFTTLVISFSIEVLPDIVS